MLNQEIQHIYYGGISETGYCVKTPFCHKDKSEKRIKNNF